MSLRQVRECRERAIVAEASSRSAQQTLQLSHGYETADAFQTKLNEILDEEKEIIARKYRIHIRHLTVGYYGIGRRAHERMLF